MLAMPLGMAARKFLPPMSVLGMPLTDFAGMGTRHPGVGIGILAAGAYNLGFLGLNLDCELFLTWWSERLLREAMIDVARMRFTDQRWMDFAPGYFDAFILKDETCNVAYWNGDTRPLRWTGSGYETNGKPLCFFHFSGFDPDGKGTFAGDPPLTDMVFKARMEFDAVLRAVTDFRRVPDGPSLTARVASFVSCDPAIARPRCPAPNSAMLCWPAVRRILRICEPSESTL